MERVKRNVSEENKNGAAGFLLGAVHSRCTPLKVESFEISINTLGGLQLLLKSSGCLSFLFNFESFALFINDLELPFTNQLEHP